MWQFDDGKALTPHPSVEGMMLVIESYETCEAA
jgi:hypothetical protein